MVTHPHGDHAPSYLSFESERSWSASPTLLGGGVICTLFLVERKKKQSLCFVLKVLTCLTLVQSYTYGVWCECIGNNIRVMYKLNYTCSPTLLQCSTNNNNVLFCVLFLQTGAHRPSQNKEQNTVKTNFHRHTCTHTHTHTHTHTKKKNTQKKKTHTQNTHTHTHTHTQNTHKTHTHTLKHTHTHTKHTHTHKTHTRFGRG